MQLQTVVELGVHADPVHVVADIARDDPMGMQAVGDPLLGLVAISIQGLEHLFIRIQAQFASQRQIVAMPEAP